jgi:nicotinate-nucleotide pyrophosphorylase (carboxylating)
MLPLSREELDAFIDTAFAEDIRDGDVTSNTVIPADAKLKAAMVARHDMVIAGMPLAMEVFLKLDPKAHLQLEVNDGGHAKAGDTILIVSGSARALLTAERTALNIVQHLSGIATLTADYVAAIDGTGATLLDTRKTLPGWRQLQKYATRMGGGDNHRMGLYDAVMIKDNHIAIAGGIEVAVTAAKTAGLENIEVECDTLDQVRTALELGVSRIMLDNMTNDQMAEAVKLTAGKAELEASGGVTLNTIRGIAETGVDYISVGRLTQSAAAVDIGLDFVL